MAWLTTYNDDNKIELDSTGPKTETIYRGNGVSISRTVERETYQYIGMTLAAADICVAAVNDAANDILATRKKENAAGAYLVEVSGTTTTPWEVV